MTQHHVRSDSLSSTVAEYSGQLLHLICLGHAVPPRLVLGSPSWGSTAVRSYSSLYTSSAVSAVLIKVYNRRIENRLKVCSWEAVCSINYMLVGWSRSNHHLLYFRRRFESAGNNSDDFHLLEQWILSLQTLQHGLASKKEDKMNVRGHEVKLTSRYTPEFSKIKQASRDEIPFRSKFLIYLFHPIPILDILSKWQCFSIFTSSRPQMTIRLRSK